MIMSCNFCNSADSNVYTLICGHGMCEPCSLSKNAPTWRSCFVCHQLLVNSDLLALGLSTDSEKDEETGTSASKETKIVKYSDVFSECPDDFGEIKFENRRKMKYFATCGLCVGDGVVYCPKDRVPITLNEHRFSETHAELDLTIIPHMFTIKGGRTYHDGCLMLAMETKECATLEVVSDAGLSPRKVTVHRDTWYKDMLALDVREFVLDRIIKFHKVPKDSYPDKLTRAGRRIKEAIKSPFKSLSETNESASELYETAGENVKTTCDVIKTTSVVLEKFKVVLNKIIEKFATLNIQEVMNEFARSVGRELGSIASILGSLYVMYKGRKDYVMMSIAAMSILRELGVVEKVTNWFTSGIAEVVEAFAVHPVAMLGPENEELKAEGMFAFLTTYLSSKLIGTIIDLPTSKKSILSYCAEQSVKFSQIERGVSAISRFVNWMKEMLVDLFTGEWWRGTKKSLTSEFSDLVEEAEAIQNLPSDKICCLIGMRRIVAFSQDAYRLSIKALKKDPTGKMYDNISKLKAALSQSLSKVSFHKRITPYMFVVTGASGIGKSNLACFMMRALLESQGIKPVIYTKSNTKFYDRYSPDTSGVLWDDTNIEINDVEFFKDMITMNSGALLQLNMASLDDKGCLFLPEVLVQTTNTPHPIANINNAEALRRRTDYKLKFIRTDKAMDPARPYGHIKVAVLDPHKSSEQVIAEMNFEEALTNLVYEFYEHRQVELKLLAQEASWSSYDPLKYYDKKTAGDFVRFFLERESSKLQANLDAFNAITACGPEIDLEEELVNEIEEDIPDLNEQNFVEVDLGDNNPERLTMEQFELVITEQKEILEGVKVLEPTLGYKYGVLYLMKSGRRIITTFTSYTESIIRRFVAYGTKYLQVRPYDLSLANLCVAASLIATMHGGLNYIPMAFSVAGVVVVFPSCVELVKLGIDNLKEFTKQTITLARGSVQCARVKSKKEIANLTLNKFSNAFSWLRSKIGVPVILKRIYDLLPSMKQVTYVLSAVFACCSALYGAKKTYDYVFPKEHTENEEQNVDDVEIYPNRMSIPVDGLYHAFLDKCSKCRHIFTDVIQYVGEEFSNYFPSLCHMCSVNFSGKSCQMEVCERNVQKPAYLQQGSIVQCGSYPDDKSPAKRKTFPSNYMQKVKLHSLAQDKDIQMLGAVVISARPLKATDVMVRAEFDDLDLLPKSAGENILQKIESNMFYMYPKNGDRTKECVQGIGVRGSTIQTYCHSLIPIVQRANGPVDFVLVTARNMVEVRIRMEDILMADISESGMKLDIAYVVMNGAAIFKDITKYYVTENMTGLIKNKNAYFIHYDPQSRESILPLHRTPTVVKDTKWDTPYMNVVNDLHKRVVGNDLTTDLIIHSGIGAVPGFCGGVFVAMVNDLPYITSTLIYGNAATNEGGGILITKERLLSSLSKTKPDLMPSKSDPEVVMCGMLRPESFTDQEIEERLAAYQLPKDADVVGILKPEFATFAYERTQMRPSRLQNVMDSEYCKPFLKNVPHLEKDGVSHIARAFDKEKRVGPWNVGTCEKVDSHMTFSKLQKLKKLKASGFPFKKLTCFEAINGFRYRGESIVDPIRKNTSPGFPLTNMREKGTKSNGKLDFLEEVGIGEDGQPTYMPNSILTREMNRMEECIKKYGFNCQQTFTIMLKDAKNKLTSPDKLRVFCMTNMAQQLVVRMYFGTLLAAFAKLNVQVHHANGLDCTREGASTVGNYLMPYTKALAMDYKKFDTNCMADQHIRFCKRSWAMIAALYDNLNLSEEKYFYAVMVPEVADRYEIRGDVVILRDSQLPSGSGVTEFENSENNDDYVNQALVDVQNMYKLAYWMTDYEVENSDDPDYYRHLKRKLADGFGKTYMSLSLGDFENLLKRSFVGDDLIMGIYQDLLKYFDCLVYREYLATKNIQVTAADKGSELQPCADVNGLEFLKRKIMPVIPGVFKMPLDQSVILDAAMWVRSKRPLTVAEENEYLQDIFCCMQREAALHGKEFYRGYVDMYLSLNDILDTEFQEVMPYDAHVREFCDANCIPILNDI